MVEGCLAGRPSLIVAPCFQDFSRVPDELRGTATWRFRTRGSSTLAVPGAPLAQLVFGLGNGLPPGVVITGERPSAAFPWQTGARHLAGPRHVVLGSEFQPRHGHWLEFPLSRIALGRGGGCKRRARRTIQPKRQATLEALSPINLLQTRKACASYRFRPITLFCRAWAHAHASRKRRWVRTMSPLYGRPRARWSA